jgi:hypothetical protein
MAKKKSNGFLIGVAICAALLGAMFSGDKRGQVPKIGCFGWLLIFITIGAAIRYWEITLVILGLVVLVLVAININKKKERPTTGVFPQNSSEYRPQPNIQPSAQRTVRIEPATSPNSFANGLPKLAPGDDFEVVGTAFYEKGFNALRDSIGATPGATQVVWVEVVAEPDNPHSKNGKAVGVRWKQYKLASISEDLNTPFFNLLQQIGGRATCQAEVTFAENSDDFEEDNEMVLLVDYPPSIAR